MPKVEKIFGIAWDNDGVLSESHKPVLEAVNLELSVLLSRPVNLVKSDLTDWDALTRLVF